MPHLNNKQNKNTNQIISRQDYPHPASLSLAHQKKNKQTSKKKEKNSAQISQSSHKPLGQSQEGRNQKEERIQPYQGTNYIHRSPNK